MPRNRGGGGGGGNRRRGDGQLQRLANVNPRRQARRDVRLIVGPQLREINRQQGQLTDEYDEYGAKIGNLYGALGGEIGGIGDVLAGRQGQIQQGYQGGLQDILSGLGAAATPDQAAFMQTLGSQAIAGQNNLSTAQIGDVGLNAAAGRSAGIESMIAQRNARGELQDALDLLKDERRGIMSDRGLMLKQRLDELRQAQFDRLLALRQLELAARNSRGLNFSGYPLPNRRRKKRDRGGGGDGGGGSSNNRGGRDNPQQGRGGNA